MLWPIALVQLFPEHAVTVKAITAYRGHNCDFIKILIIVGINLCKFLGVSSQLDGQTHVPHLHVPKGPREYCIILKKIKLTSLLHWQKTMQNWTPFN